MENCIISFKCPLTQIQKQTLRDWKKIKYLLSSYQVYQIDKV